MFVKVKKFLQCKNWATGSVERACYKKLHIRKLRKLSKKLINEDVK